LIWSSLWWLFLVKYLSENNFPKNISELHLVAPLFNDEWLVNEYVWDFALDINKVSDIEKKANKVSLYFSEDDPVLPFKQHKYYKELLKNSKFFIFQDRWHFSQPAFPELLENIDKS
jgi:predicted alpha/beta hydrolase family esterase